MPSHADPFGRFPLDIQYLLLGNLSPSDVLSCRLVCSPWKDAIEALVGSLPTLTSLHFPYEVSEPSLTARAPWEKYLALARRCVRRNLGKPTRGYATDLVLEGLADRHEHVPAQMRVDPHTNIATWLCGMRLYIRNGGDEVYEYLYRLARCKAGQIHGTILAVGEGLAVLNITQGCCYGSYTTQQIPRQFLVGVDLRKRETVFVNEVTGTYADGWYLQYEGHRHASATITGGRFCYIPNPRHGIVVLDVTTGETLLASANVPWLSHDLQVARVGLINDGERAVVVVRELGVYDFTVPESLDPEQVAVMILSAATGQLTGMLNIPIEACWFLSQELNFSRWRQNRTILKVDLCCPPTAATNLGEELLRIAVYPNVLDPLVGDVAAITWSVVQASAGNDDERAELALLNERRYKAPDARGGWKGKAKADTIIAFNPWLHAAICAHKRGRNGGPWRFAMTSFEPEAPTVDPGFAWMLPVQRKDLSWPNKQSVQEEKQRNKSKFRHVTFGGDISVYRIAARLHAGWVELNGAVLFF